MTVSVVIPCYNLGRYLLDAVKSVQAQTYSDYEIIIVDDGSTDPATKKIIQRISKENPDLLVFTKKNGGLADTRNYGIKKSTGEYIVCLDADDMLAPDYLQKTVEVLDNDKSKKLGFVTTWLQEFGERNNIWRASDYDVSKLLLNNIVHAASLFRKEAWAKAGGYKSTMRAGYEDWEFWLSLVELGYQWRVVNEPLFFYRIRDNSMLTTAKLQHLDLYRKLFEIHEAVFIKYFKDLIIENAQETKDLHQAISQKNRVISEMEEYREEVISLREQIFKLRDEVNSLRNSRVLGRIIRVRDVIGHSRQKIAPRLLAHKIRVVVAPFIPGPVRRTIKAQLKKVLRPAPKVRMLHNQEWTDGPLVSVIIPYYNRANTIDETLESLASQTYRDFETIVIDDGSIDPESIKKFNNLSVSGLKPALIKQENRGVAATRNNGIKLAKGKYVICLDSDDALDSTFIEKCTVMLEVNPDISIATTYMQSFGVINEPYRHVPYNPLEIIQNNMVITAAEYKKTAWQVVDGYKSGIGYEDWDFWVSLSENGFWAKLIPEPLFKYRTAMQSRYVGDKDAHWKNINSIKKLHPNYKKNVKKLMAAKRAMNQVIEPLSAFINLDDEQSYRQPSNNKPNVLIIVPWLTFGGAETLILNFCHEIKDNFNLSFVTGLHSEHEWEHKFREITDRIYHLTNLFDNEDLYVEFISNYIKTRNVAAIHIIHTGYVFKMLPELKQRHPRLKIAITLFNDRAAHFNKSMEVKQYIDAFTTDNSSVYKRYEQELGDRADIRVIPNAINSIEIFNPILYDRIKQRNSLDLDPDDLAVFFIGRISEEKNPDVFLEVASRILQQSSKIKFYIIGDGLMAPAVIRQVNSINSPNIVYLGYKSNIADYLSAADIFVLPSSIEGFPLSILEAMAMRVAVIASDVGAVSEVITNNEDGFVVSPGSAEEIAGTIISLDKNRKKLDQIKLKARAKVDKKYSNEILGRNYRQLYRDIIT